MRLDKNYSKQSVVRFLTERREKGQKLEDALSCTQLTVMPVSMCCTGTGATMAMGFALQVQFMFRPCSQLVYCLLFSLSIPAFLLRDPTHLGSGRVVAGVGPLVLRALVAAHAGGLCPLSSAGSGGGQDSILGSKPHLQVSSDAGLYATRYVSRLDITYTNLIMYAKFLPIHIVMIFGLV